ncbi:MAG: hypothetical protein LBK42_11565 [Propionibacteriaceae bacterium]|jgi:hypothetical protein|nr:hypothetical protein [Propionibacteriaceae bacterium]
MAKKAKDKEKKVAPAAKPSGAKGSKLSSDTLKTIAAQVKARKAAQEAIDAAVIKARGEGSSWVQIAIALGISPQGARQKYLARISA